MDPTEQTVAQIVAEVAGAMKEAAAEYGPQAADLALLAYRVDAIQKLIGAGLMAGAVYGLWRGWKWLFMASVAWDEESRDIARWAAGTMAACVAGVLALNTVLILSSIPTWLAAFGNPELLIATRALRAAGLM